ncbi:MAG: cation-translocating P-type ATPase [Oscillospiraceae bacterium]|nr:cation-translocating P-type ATPase [Oscillospiraceae bacterium]MBQ5655909.1 cation-translocating P-type ATPase [Bacteroidaceae bacterium]MBR2310279.1 cation-translocating P-type ATPase [Oscillospiraceae bacterium]
MKQEYIQSSSEILQEMGVTEAGLSSAEAKKRREQYGPNKLKDAEKKSMLRRFLDQLKDPMLIILMVAAAVSAVTNIIAGESLAEVFIILIVVLLNAILGVVQESKAEAAIEALQTMTAATCKVIRDSKQIFVHSDELVPGDIVVLEAGDAVPADGRIIECASLKIEEAALTGESVPVNKMVDVLTLGKGQDEIALGDRKNMCYMGSTAVYGRGKMVVTRTGMETEMGKIAGVLAATEDEQTPLQRKLGELSTLLSKLVLGICVFIFAFNLIRAGDFHLPVILDTFMVAVSLAVAAIPEGLSTVVTLVLSIGVTNMSKRNAVIRKMTAVETLGCTQVICSDKTGTLTQNKMTVVDHLGDTQLLATAMALCSDAHLNDENQAEGEPTEAALANFAYSLGLKKQDLEAATPRVDEAPFDSGRKMMSTIHDLGGSFVQYTKGGPDVVLARCTSYIEKGEVKPMTAAKMAEIMADNKVMADCALRVLAAAKRDWSTRPTDNTSEYLEQDLCFIGLAGMIDPVRPEVKDAIAECRAAGIRPVMITGDHKDTAVAIAKELGIIAEASQAITGAELDDIPDSEICEAVKKYSVYARVQPEHKTRIVNAWKQNGAITAMTGDGVNDAPSIKSADIGVGMGITGTDVTKNVADMVLADDNFATIVSAVGEGRRIYDNIRKAIQFLLASNMSEVLGVFVSSLLGFTLLNPVHLLFINLITDTFPALALGMEKGEPDTMERPPRDSGEGIFARGLGVDVVYQGVLVTVITIISYLIGNYFENGAFFPVVGGVSDHGMTMAFLTMSMCEIFHSFNVRSQRKSIFSLKSHNKVLWLSMVVSLLLTTLVLEVPFLANAFGFTPIGLTEYLIALAMGLLVIPVVEIVKFFQRKATKK